jgi:lipopolysaccharide heptosyltransferase I
MQSTTLADKRFERILLIKLSAIGDVIHTIPLLNALRRHYPTARIDWLSKPTPAEFVSVLPAVDEALVYGENQTEVPQYNWDGVTHFVRLIRDHRFLAMLSRLRAARYDLVIDMQGQMRSGFVSMVTGAPVRIGFDRPRKAVWQAEGRALPPGTIERAWKGAREGSWMAYTHRIRLPTLAMHAIDRYLLVGDMLGFERETPDFSIRIRPEAERRVDELLRERVGAMAKPPIVIAPAALWETKRWQAEGFAAVARHFLAQGYPVLLAGAPNEAQECEAIAAAAPGAVVLAGRTSLAELAALIRRSAIAVTNDSGPAHLATALGRPVVTMFGPTNPVWVGPYQRPDSVVSANVACSPCNLRNLSRCPHDHACMRGIAPERVIGAVEEQLAAAARSAGPPG